MPENLTPTSRASRLITLALVVVILVGLQFRLAVVLGSEVVIPLRGDAGQYFTYAFHLRNDGVYSGTGAPPGESASPDHLRNPGYPLLLVPFVGDVPLHAALLNITLLQAALSAAVILLIYLVARSTLTPPAALGVALLTAISPHLINVNIYILSESAASLTTVLFLFAFIRCGTRHERTNWPGWLLCGALLGIATLVRPTMQWFLLAAIALLYLLPAQTRHRRALWFAFGFLLTMAPWWVRNLLQFGELSNPMLMIYSLQHGMYPNFMYANQPETFGFPYRFDPRTVEITRSLGSLLAEITRRFAEQPAEHLNWFLLGKPLMFWNWSNDAQGAGDVFIYPVTKTPFLTSMPLFLSHEAMYWLHWPLVALGMAGSVLCWLPRAARAFGPLPAWAWRVSGALLLYFVALHILAAPFPRYSIPILPVLYLQSVGTLVFVYHLIKSPLQNA